MPERYPLDFAAICEIDSFDAVCDLRKLQEKTQRVAALFASLLWLFTVIASVGVESGAVDYLLEAK
jgi:hypothetical protein